VLPFHPQSETLGTLGTSLVEARQVVKDYPLGQQTVHALRGLSLNVVEGEFVAVMGPSGCGKSTLLHLLGCIEPPTAGEVFFRGQSVSRLSEAERSRLRLRSIGFVFQRFFLLPMLTAEENVALPMIEAGVPRAERTVRARELLEYVGLGERLRHKPSQLSGGEMQRVAIARALANRPSLLLADEPTGELDAATGAQIAALFRRLNADGMCLVLVTHNADLAAAAGRLVRMRDGRLEE
jgi:putative ABC transport system ATP-binding protein